MIFGKSKRISVLEKEVRRMRDRIFDLELKSTYAKVSVATAVRLLYKHLKLKIQENPKEITTVDLVNDAKDN